MESKPPMQKQNTKKRLLYNRQRTYSDGNNLEAILKKDPKDMTELEKTIWKVEILK